MTSPSGIDYLAATLTLIVFVISMLTLFGMGILMAVGAVFNNRPLVTSWSAEQEHSFAPYERRSASISARAWTLSFIGATIVTIFTAAVYLGVEPEKDDISKDMNMSNLTQKRTVAPKTEATPATPKADSAAPAEAPAADSTATPPATKE